MYFIIASATAFEIAGTQDFIVKNARKYNGHELEFVITGIGGTMTAYTLTKNIRQRRPDYIIQAGVAGSFTPAYPLGSPLLVKEEVFADLGATDNGRLADIFDLNLADGHQHPFIDNLLVNPWTEEWKTLHLPMVRSASVNAISSTPQQVEAIRQKYDPALESMEGAALHFVCLMENVPFLQLRTISNEVGDRNKANWKMKEAIAKLNSELSNIITVLFSRY